MKIPYRFQLAGRWRLLSIALVCLVSVAACSNLNGAASEPFGVSPTVTSTSLPSFTHIFVIVMENEGADAVLGNPSAPFINTLADQYTQAREYYAVSHPSLPNYLALTSGATEGYDGSDCSVNSNDCHVAGSNTNLADEIEASGRTWIAYMESMPHPCGLDDSDLYAVRHNPFVYYDDIRNGPNNRCATHDVPYDTAQFQRLLASEAAPNFVWITPNLCHDGHNDCGGNQVAQGDAWLGQNVPLILASSAFQHGGALFITWDEGSGSQTCCGLNAGGGRVATLVVSPLARHSYLATSAYSHFSLLRTIEDSWHLGELNNTNPTVQAGTVAMSDCFIAR